MTKYLIQRTKQLLSARPFRPSPLDHHYSLKERLRGQPIWLMNFGPWGVKLALAHFSDSLHLGEVSFFPSIQELLLTHFAQYPRCDNIAVSYSHKVLTRLELARRPGFLIQNNQSIVCDFSKQPVLDLQDQLEKIGLRLLRLWITPLSLLNYILAPDVIDPNHNVVIFDQSQLTLLLQLNGVWETVRSAKLRFNQDVSLHVEDVSAFEYLLESLGDHPCLENPFQYLETHTSDASFKTILNQSSKLAHLKLYSLSAKHFSTQHSDLELLAHD